MRTIILSYITISNYIILVFSQGTTPQLKLVTPSCGITVRPKSEISTVKGQKSFLFEAMSNERFFFAYSFYFSLQLLKIQN